MEKQQPHTATQSRRGCWTGKRERHGELLSRLRESNNSGMSSKEETFTALAAAFRFDDATTDLFLKGPMESLEDFQYYFTGEREIDEYLQAELGPEAIPSIAYAYNCSTGEPTQATRVKRAWRAIRRLDPGDRDGHTLAQIWMEADHTAMKQIIAEAKRQFWERYKITYPVKIAPTDKLLFACHKEMEERRLTCYDIRKVKSILEEATSPSEQSEYTSGSSQEHHEPNRRKEVSAPTPHGVREYMAKLYTYLLALATVGTHKVHGAPPEEVFGSDSTMFVQTPWDILQAYYFQVSRAILTFPEESRLARLEATDTAERSIWVHRFCTGNQSLGNIVKSVLKERLWHWDKSTQSWKISTGTESNAEPSGCIMAQQSTEEQDSQVAAIDRAILTAQASADIARHTLGSSSAPVGAPPESQQAHQQRLASLLHFRADRASDIPKSDIHRAPPKPVPPDCKCCVPRAYACAACCAWYPTL